MALTERTQQRLKREREKTEVTLTLPTDAIEAMQAIAQKRGLRDYRSVMMCYLSEGLRRDEAEGNGDAESA